MLKKRTIAGLSVLVGGIMLVTTAFAGISGSSGYDAYKSALKNTIVQKSITANMQVSLKDNDKSLLDLVSVYKTNSNAKTMSNSTDIKTGSSQKSFQTYSTEGKTITKNSDSDVYSVMESNGKGIDKNKMELTGTRKEQAMKSAEKIVDALVGNLQTYVNKTQNSGGTSEITLKLSDGQIPAVANAVISFAMEQSAYRTNENRLAKMGHMGMPNIVNDLPKLTGDVTVKSVEMDAVVTAGNLIQKQTVKIMITGKDANGTAHDVELGMNGLFSAFNATTPNTIDLTGKNVKTVNPGKMMNEQGKE